jgi:hypothetical protein
MTSLEEAGMVPVARSGPGEPRDQQRLAPLHLMTAVRARNLYPGVPRQVRLEVGSLDQIDRLPSGRRGACSAVPAGPNVRPSLRNHQPIYRNQLRILTVRSAPPLDSGRTAHNISTLQPSCRPAGTISGCRTGSSATRSIVTVRGLSISRYVGAPRSGVVPRPHRTPECLWFHACSVSWSLDHVGHAQNTAAPAWPAFRSSDCWPLEPRRCSWARWAISDSAASDKVSQ